MLLAVFSRAWLLTLTRVLVGVAAVVVGALALDPERSLGLAVVLFGAFVLGHAVVDYSFQAIRQDYTPPVDTGMRDFAASFVATSGVILGLLAVFGDHPLSPTIKVGIVALVTDILVGTVLVGLLLASADPDDQPAWNLLRYVFNIALWGLSLGLLCIAMGLIYR